MRHPYLDFDAKHINKFNIYEKYILPQKGGTQITNGNNTYQYHFEIQGNTIFIGRCKECLDIYVEENKAIIIGFGYQKTCSVKKDLETGKGTRHMFL